MNTRHISLAFAAITIASLLAGCAKSPIEEVKPSEQLTDLELSYVGATETKAAIDGTSFPEEGEIGLFLFGDEAATKSYGTGYENIQYSYDEAKGKWTASPSIKVGSETGYLYGYYPYSATATNVKAITVKSSLNGDDVMYATTQTVTDATASQTSITMNHALARVSIKVVNNGYTGDAKLTKIKFAGAEIAPTGTLNALDGSITAAKSDVTLDVTGDAQTITAAGTTYECLLVPSAVISSRQTVALTLTIDGEDKQATLSSDNGVIIARGTKSNITITLSNSGISVQTVSVEDWTVVEVGGHKVTVKRSDETGIASDVFLDVTSDGSAVTIKALSGLTGRFTKCTCTPDGKATCSSSTDETTGICTFTISDVQEDITAELGYKAAWKVSVKFDSSRGSVKLNGNPLTSGKNSWAYHDRVNELSYTLASGFRFFRWSDADRSGEVSRSANIAIVADTTLTAEFCYEDAIPGLFSVSTAKRVFFSKGNLYCSGVTFHNDKTMDNYGAVASMSNAMWGFESNQYDSKPTSSGNRHTSHISHFMWCNAAVKAMALKYESSWDQESPFFAEKNFTVNGFSSWRALTGGEGGEWEYLLETRTMKYSKPRYTTVFGVSIGGVTCNGLFIYPDDYNGNEIESGGPGTWADINAAGIVFLPAAGSRDGDPGGPILANVSDVGSSGYYWSASQYEYGPAFFLRFSSGNVFPSGTGYCEQAYSVRLVTESK